MLDRRPTTAIDEGKENALRRLSHASVSKSVSCLISKFLCRITSIICLKSPKRSDLFDPILCAVCGHAGEASSVGEKSHKHE